MTPAPSKPSLTHFNPNAPRPWVGGGRMGTRHSATMVNTSPVVARFT